MITPPSSCDYSDTPPLQQSQFVCNGSWQGGSQTVSTQFLSLSSRLHHTRTRQPGPVSPFVECGALPCQPFPEVRRSSDGLGGQEVLCWPHHTRQRGSRVVVKTPSGESRHGALPCCMSEMTSPTELPESTTVHPGALAIRTDMHHWSSVCL